MKLNGTDKVIMGAGIGIVLVWFGAVATIAYVVIHFISKFW